MILVCPSLQIIRNEMFLNLTELDLRHEQTLLDKGDLIDFILGKQCQEITQKVNLEFNVICAIYIDRMYRTITSRRTGVG